MREGETREERRKRQEWTQDEIDRAIKAQAAIPPLWVSVGAKNLAEGSVWPAMLGTLGGLAIGGLGLRRAYRSTLRFYHGETGGKASARAPSTGTPRRQPRLVDEPSFASGAPVAARTGASRSRGARHISIHAPRA